DRGRGCVVCLEAPGCLDSSECSVDQPLDVVCLVRLRRQHTRCAGGAWRDGRRARKLRGQSGGDFCRPRLACGRVQLGASGGRSGLISRVFLSCFPLFILSSPLVSFLSSPLLSSSPS